MKPEDSLKAAIVCVHIAQGAPILRAIRDEPLDEADSGWQFVCDSGEEEREAEAQVWALKNVVKDDDALASFVERPVGTVLRRLSQRDPWMLSPER
jgi:hypothetical protein